MQGQVGYVSLLKRRKDRGRGWKRNSAQLGRSYPTSLSLSLSLSLYLSWDSCCKRSHGRIHADDHRDSLCNCTARKKNRDSSFFELQENSARQRSNEINDFYFVSIRHVAFHFEMLHFVSYFIHFILIFTTLLDILYYAGNNYSCMV